MQLSQSKLSSSGGGQATLPGVWCTLSCEAKWHIIHAELTRAIIPRLECLNPLHKSLKAVSV